MGINKVKNIETCYVLSLALTVVFMIYRIDWLLYAALVLGFIGLFIPFLANLIRIAWYQLAALLGAISSRVLLAVIFFLLLTPIAFIYRLIHSEKWDYKQKTSAWISRNHVFGKEDLEQPW